MFTGIIQATASIASIIPGDRLKTISIPLPPALLLGLTQGASVSVNGVCLTVTAIQNNAVSFDIGNETLERTTLGDLHTGSRINIERSLKMGDEIGGHLLSGHIIGTARVSNITDLSSEQRIITLSCDINLMKYIFTKGYIALNGVSLTLGETDPAGFFNVHLIPETLKRTCFNEVMLNDKVNVEVDSQTLAVVQTVERVMAEYRL